MPGLDSLYIDTHLHKVMDKDRDLCLVHSQHELIPPALPQERLPLRMAELFRRKGRIRRVQLDDGPGRIEQLVRTPFDNLFPFIDDEHTTRDQLHLAEQM